MFKNLDKHSKRFTISLVRSIYYSAVIAFLILQIGCGRTITSQMAEEETKKANASLPYGKSPNRIVASKTGALFY